MARTAKELIAEARERIEEISPAEANARLERGGVAIDVREADELRKKGCLPGAVHIPRGLLEYRIGKAPGTDDPQTWLVVYCGGGGRGALATHTLRELGYANAASLAGGMDAWVESGYPVEQRNGGE